ncbi:hypothetical protein GGS23DRAFT_51307 [Durotheca rogersii]|uniref:uncharacterized protein n=1 Tax=Durotheca rogersii TaxID=419775 RepID=UPI00221FBF3B|nr:uncharacterized protein GGS23DRAFT_51307 [Durotheca rogersii]KAI5863070.1 hypothetical protein GGS23DRAFT_51307 [Durotheca rogersii]
MYRIPRIASTCARLAYGPRHGYAFPTYPGTKCVSYDNDKPEIVEGSLMNEQSDCKALFLTKSSADEHVRGHLRFICPVPRCKDAVMGRAKRSLVISHNTSQQHRESDQFSNLINIPDPTEIVVSARPADEHDEDESDPVLDDDTIDDFEEDDDSFSEDFNHGVSAIFPLARVTAAVETVGEQRCCLLK